MDYFDKQYHPPGTPPGTLPQDEFIVAAEVHSRLICYDDDHFEKSEGIRLDEIEPGSHDPHQVRWLAIHGAVSGTLLRELGERFQLHPLTVEDMFNQGQRPKVELFPGYLFVILRQPLIMDGAITIGQVSLLLKENLLISVVSGETDPFGPVHERLEHAIGKIRQRGADHLLYCLIDALIDLGFPLLEWFSERIERLEEEVIHLPSQQTLRELHALRRELLLLRQTLWPQREVVGRLLHEQEEWFQSETQRFMRDCHDHIIQIMELLETYREMTSGLLELYLSSSNYRLSEVMKVLTIIATLFIPLTFIVGVYGMNFSVGEGPWSMPELRWRYGYPLLWLVMLAITGGMLLYFKRKRWF